MTYISTTSLQSIRLDKKFIQVLHNNLQERSNKLFGQPNRYYPNPHFTKGKLRPGAIRPLAQGDLEASWLRSLSFLEEGELRAMRNVGPGPPRVFLRQPDPRGLSEEPRTASPVSCHPAPYISCCCPHGALTHWGTPPSTPSQREVQASPPPIHVHTATVSTAAAPPSRRGGPSLSWFPATSSFRQGPTVADLAACDGRQGSQAYGGQRLKMAPVVGLEAGGGGGRRQGLGSFLLEGPPR